MKKKNNVFERLNIRLAAKKTAFIGCFLFLSSCGTFMGLTEVEETVDDSQQMVVVETIEEESSPEKVLFTESETEPVEAYSETITEEIVVSTFEDVPPYSISVE